MKENRITAFDIKICLSQRQQLKFCVVSPNEFQHDAAAGLAAKIKIFTDYHLAIRPNVPVILFELETPANIGAPLYKPDEKTTVYHVPPDEYPTLEESLKETDFLISYTLLKKIIEADKVYTSLLDSLGAFYEENGLNVLGVIS